MYTFSLIMGIAAYSFILFSFLTGMKIIKVKYKIHKRIGIIGFTCASMHAILMLLQYFGLI